MSKEKILTIDDLPMHKDTYFFGYGINIDKPYEMANQIIKLKKENQELKILNKRYKEIITDNKENYELFSSEIKNLKTQQKEFIEWLQANLEALIMCDREFILTNNKKEIKAYSEILSKYKEIIGVKDE